MPLDTRLHPTHPSPPVIPPRSLQTPQPLKRSRSDCSCAVLTTLSSHLRRRPSADRSQPGPGSCREGTQTPLLLIFHSFSSSSCCSHALSSADPIKYAALEAARKELYKETLQTLQASQDFDFVSSTWPICSEATYRAEAGLGSGPAAGPRSGSGSSARSGSAAAAAARTGGGEQALAHYQTASSDDKYKEYVDFLR